MFSQNNRFKNHPFSLGDEEIDIVRRTDEQYGIKNLSATLRMILRDWADRRLKQKASDDGDEDVIGTA